MKVRAIDFVISHVTDVKEGVRFYRETLGIEEPFIKDEFVSGDGETDTWTEFATVPVTLALARWEQEAGRPGIALAVDDVHETVEELRSKGVTIVMEPTDSGSCWMAWVKDPWGNLLCIHRRKDGMCG
jgi:predicted enzyme related to lactoylglutathione lyase